MKKPLLRNIWFSVVLAATFLVLDQLADRVLGVRPGVALPHIVLVALVLLVSFVLMRQATEAHQRAEAALRQARDELETRVRERTAELEHTHAALQSVNERLELTQAASGVGSWDWDIPSRRLEWSPKMFDLFGLDMHTTAASFDAWRSVLHAEDREVAERRINVALETHSELASEYRIMRPDGQLCWISTLGSGFYDEKGNPIRMSGICLDITDRKVAEAKVEHLSSFPQLNPNPVLEIDASGRISFRNEATREALERSGLEDDARAFLPDDLAAILQAVNQKKSLALQREVQVGEATFSETIQVIPAFDAVRIYAFEITKRKRAIEALRQSEERFRLALKNAPVTVAAQDKDLHFIWAYNQRTVRPEDVIGKTDADLFPPDTAARLIALKRQVLETGAEVSQRIWVESGNRQLYLDLYLEPIRNESGEIIGVGIATVDLTDRKRAEDALRASEEKFATAFRFSPTGLIVIRRGDGAVLDVNEAFLRSTGYVRSEVVGASVRDADFIASTDALSRLAGLFLDEGQVMNHELEFRTRDGEIATMLVSLASINVGEEACMLAVALDITERKRSDEALRRAEAELALASQERARMEERQRLARELHDSVSQALYGISLGTHTALTQLDTNRNGVLEALSYVLSMARAALDEMRALIFDLRPESLELEGLVVGLTRQSTAVRARHGIDVEVSLCDEPDVPLPVKEALYRIAQEALHNAIKHARADRLDVRLAREQGSLSLEVRDNGMGFDPLAAYPGHLGLRSMRERAMSVGGRLDIASAPGTGTQVLAHFPIPGTPGA